MRVPSGTAAATSPMSDETADPIATRSAPTPTSSANPALACATGSSNSRGRPVPARHPATAPATASATAAEGMPMLAVFRYPSGTSNSWPNALRTHETLGAWTAS
jgi:hypothetical protein